MPNQLIKIENNEELVKFCELVHIGMPPDNCHVWPKYVSVQNSRLTLYTEVLSVIDVEKVVEKVRSEGSVSAIKHLIENSGINVEELDQSVCRNLRMSPSDIQNEKDRVLTKIRLWASQKGYDEFSCLSDKELFTLCLTLIKNGVITVKDQNTT